MVGNDFAETIVLEMNLAKGCLGGIGAAGVLHFLKVDQIREAFEKPASWLAIGGRLVLTSSTSLCRYRKELFNKTLYKSQVFLVQM